MDSFVYAVTNILVGVFVFAVGASVGSFLNVVIYRLPAGLSVLWPPSRCPKCLNRLKPYQNVPVFGWLWLKGRCHFCKTKISSRYPLVEGFTGLIFLAVFWVFQFSPLTIGYWAFCSWLLALSMIDFDTMTLPNQLTKSGLVAGIVFHLVLGLLSANSSVGVAKHLMTSIGGATLGIWLFDGIAVLGSIIFKKAAMGSGDAKLAAMMGAWLGWRYLLLASFIGCFIGAVIGIGAILLLGRTRDQKIPFGPFLALGAVITLFVGENMLSGYMKLFLV
ncbi:prepilin peptidase [Anabaena sp. FACHB-1237]|uniref:prepilin peptidase n=1 Tax=Anabaena sp. FACHB-1237 TaxID=2692769 RepID=UPI0016807830|nr:A24 family peptidase [Anabaena sp. FACHB-1237]MBD2138572.1 prepilin peptidase [Anabaena sp. FACHB-1237]